ncbi:MAG TPA: ABC transporter ATP-binding protein [Anaerolineales bacterium]|nr:ABC transporter ATP-binding protein [Anaerolineales bacterium]
MSAEPLLSVADLKTVFHTKGKVVTAVAGMSFEIKQGETLGIVGESGSGKSVTMLSIMRLIPSPPGRIVGGKIMFQGRDLLQLNKNEMRKVRGKEIAMIFQDPMTSLNPVLTISQQMSETLQVHLRLDRAAARARALDLLKLVGIPDAVNRLDDYPHQFSGGMRQRVMIALSLSCHPKLLIADEPTTALDVTIQAQITALVKRLRNETGMAVIWITHDLGIVAGMVDRIVVMYAAHIMESAPVRDLYADPRHPYTLGLLGAVPRLDTAGSKRLHPIPGLPPDLANPPKGCPFVPRCPYRMEKCFNEKPPLRPVAQGHATACWLDVDELKRSGHVTA